MNPSAAPFFAPHPSTGNGLEDHDEEEEKQRKGVKAKEAAQK